MNIVHMLIFGFAATIILTSVMAASLGLGLTRMDIPLMLGSMFTPDRDLAKVLGFGLNLVNGWIFALFYLALLRGTHQVNGWAGMATGLMQSCFVLLVALPALPHLHPRMATEERGPDPTRQLEPPGFMALNYGRGTPVATIVAHLLYGGALGFFYHQFKG